MIKSNIETIRFDAAYVHIFGGNAPIDEASPTGDVLVGRYADHIDIVSLSATLRFWKVGALPASRSFS